MTLERRMTHLARLYAANDRHIRLGSRTYTPGYRERRWAIVAAISRAKLPYYGANGSRAITLLVEARALDCLSTGGLS